MQQLAGSSERLRFGLLCGVVNRERFYESSRQPFRVLAYQLTSAKSSRSFGVVKPNVKSVPKPPREAEDTMKSLATKVQRFLVSEDGPTAVEYAVMLALIVIVCLTAIRSIGTNASATFNSVSAQLGS